MSPGRRPRIVKVSALPSRQDVFLLAADRLHRGYREQAVAEAVAFVAHISDQFFFSVVVVHLNRNMI